MLYGAERLGRYDPARPLVVCEGEPATDAAIGLGLQAVGTVTGAGTVKAPKAIGPKIAGAIASRFAAVILWPDNDDEGRAHMNANALALERAGVASVRLLRWDDAPAHGDAADFAALGRSADDALALVIADRPARLAGGAPPAAPMAGHDVEGYGVDAEGRTFRVGARALVTLANFSARIVSQARADEGEGAHDRDEGETAPYTHFELEARLAGETEARRFGVPALDFASLEWVAERLGASATIAPGRTNREHLANAVRELSDRPIPTRAAHGHLGWCVVDGTPAYVHAGGAIGPDGPLAGVDVALPEALERYHFPAPAEGAALASAIRATLELLDVAPRPVMTALLGGAFRSVLGPISSSLFLSGPTGAGKSQLGAIVSRLFGPAFDYDSLPATWSSTANSLEELAHAAASALFVVDDFVSDGASADSAQAQRDGARVLRAVGNHAGRGRLRRDSTYRAGKPPRALIVSTGEIIPGAESVRARTLLLELHRDELNGEARDRAFAAGATGELAAGMAAYVRWIAATHHPELARTVSASRTRLMRHVAAEHGRTSTTIAELGVGWECWLSFAVTCGALDAREADARWSGAWRALLAAAALHSSELRLGTPHLRFRRALATAIAKGAAHVAAMDGGRPDPESPAPFGWRAGTIPADWRPQGERIGWVSDGDLYLEPGATRVAAERVARESGEPIGASERVLWGELADAGLLRVDKNGKGHRRYTVKVSGIEGARRSVLHLPATFLLDVSDDDEHGDGSGGDPDVPRRDFGGPPDGDAAETGRHCSSNTPDAPARHDAEGEQSGGPPSEVLAWPEEYRGWWAETVAYARASGLSESEARDAATRDIREQLKNGQAPAMAQTDLAADPADDRVRAAPAEREESERAAALERDPGPSAKRARPSSAPRAASEWYANVATDGRIIVAADGTTRELGAIADAGELAAAARAIIPARELIVWVHERAAEPFALPERLPVASSSSASSARVNFVQHATDRGVAVRDYGASGWAIAESPGESPVHLAFPAYSGDFAGTADAAELLASVERFRDAVGLAFAFSGASTLHNLIRRRSSSRARAIAASLPEPVLSPAYAPTAYAVQAHAWARELDEAERSRSWVRAFDRSGSYLASWNGCVLSEGGWTQRQDARRLERLAERAMPAGYFRIAVAPLARALAAEGLADPFARQGDDSGEAWLTAPLAQLAAELAEERGIALDVIRSYEPADQWRALDPAAARLSAARAELAGDPSPAATRALVALKDAYAGAVAWLEYGPRVPAQLARPHWRRTVLDRTIANAWRALRGASPHPFAIGEVDTALFALNAPDAIPTGLRIGGELGAWRAKGGAVPMSEARELLASGGPLAILRRLEELGARG